MQILIMIFLGLLLLYFTIKIKEHDQQCCRDLPVLPGLSAVLFDIPRLCWRLAKVDITTRTCHKEYGKLWLSLISDLK